jgi:hypothetical protein
MTRLLFRGCEGRWVCQQCGTVLAQIAAPTNCRECQSEAISRPYEPLDPEAVILSRLTPTGVDRLQRCRAAECRLMLEVEGSMRCVGMPGSKCQWIAAWAKRLNDVAWVCPHWLPVVPPSTEPTESVDPDPGRG